MNTLSNLNKTIILFFLSLILLYTINILGYNQNKIDRFENMVFDVILNTRPYVAPTPNPISLRRMLCTTTDNQNGMCLDFMEIRN